MSSGQKREIFNSNERALSTDMNRLQAFAAAHRSELMRALINTPTGFDDLDAGGVESPITSQSTPVAAEILTGLRFAPTGGGTDCTITAGVVGMLDPDTTPNADDSPYKIIVDPGLGSGQIALTANSSGSTRIDFVECSRLGVPGGGGTSSSPDLVTETANRDVFNNSTGLFTPTSVNKVALGQLQYRIRTGSPGAGIPARNAGWLPLAVVAVPNGASTWDTCTIWDVRPLLADRERAFNTAVVDKPFTKRLEINAQAPTSIAGVVEAVFSAETGSIIAPILGGRRVGGKLLRGTPGTDGNIDATAAINRETGFSATADTPWYLYLCFPAGLPRWVRYTDGPSGRVPRATRGIPIAAMAAPDTYGMREIFLSASIFGTSTASIGYAIAAGYFDHSTAMKGFYGTERSGLFLCNAPSIFPDPDANNVLDPIDHGPVSGSTSATFNLTAGVDYPPHAREVLVEFRYRITANDTIQGLWSYVDVEIPNGSTVESKFRAPFQPTALSDVSAQQGYGFQIWIPLASVYPSLTAPTQNLVLNTNSISASQSAIVARMRILGWKL